VFSRAAGLWFSPVGDHAPARPASASGRGLLLVDVLTSRWWVLGRDPVGKTVRAELDL
jgi:hypothetical protein